MLRADNVCFGAMTEAFNSATLWHGSIPKTAFAVIIDGPRVLLRDDAASTLGERLPRYEEMFWHIEPEATWHFMGEFAGTWGTAPVMAWSLSIAPDGFVWADVRSLLGALTPVAFDLLGRCMQVLEWADTHRFCGRCGGPMQSHARGERSRVCGPCGSSVYPRINPCVIAIISRGDELLLAQSTRFTNGMYSALAGFMEVGESAEQTLTREVREEVGVEIANIRYHASQSWPFSSSLMLGFFADYVGGDIVCQEDEIADAQFFHYQQLPLVPPKGSIARALIDQFIVERQTHHA
jgi:NAD+ diphosphatase